MFYNIKYPLNSVFFRTVVQMYLCCSLCIYSFVAKFSRLVVNDFFVNLIMDKFAAQIKTNDI